MLQTSFVGNTFTAQWTICVWNTFHEMQKNQWVRFIPCSILISQNGQFWTWDFVGYFSFVFNLKLISVARARARVLSWFGFVWRRKNPIKIHFFRRRRTLLTIRITTIFVGICLTRETVTASTKNQCDQIGLLLNVAHKKFLQKNPKYLAFWQPFALFWKLSLFKLKLLLLLLGPF